MYQLLNFEKIITQVGSLKSQNLHLAQMVILVENLLKILEFRHSLHSSKVYLSSKINSDQSLAKNLEVEKLKRDRINEENLATSLPVQRLTKPEELSSLMANLTLFLSAHDFLLWSLQAHWVQNQFEFDLSKLKSNQRSVAKKWANLLEIWREIIQDLQNSQQFFPSQSPDLADLIIAKLLKLGENWKLIKPDQNCTFILSKNLIEVKIPKPSFNLADHFEKLLTKLESSDLNYNQGQNKELETLEKNNFDSNLHLVQSPNSWPSSPKILKIQTNLSQTDFQSLIEICHLRQLFEFWQKSQKLEIQYLEIDPEVDNLAKISMNWKIEERVFKRSKSLEQDSFKEEIKLEESNDNSAPEILKPPVNDSVENCQVEFLASSNLELFLKARQEICQQSEKHVGILCGQNSTLNDCQSIVTKANYANYLILGESGSLTKIASKLSHRNSQLVILKNNDFLYLHGAQDRQNLNYKQNDFAEIWWLGQPYLALDKFWSPVFHPTLKQLYWQAQINQLVAKNPQAKIGVIRSFWK